MVRVANHFASVILIPIDELNHNLPGLQLVNLSYEIILAIFGIGWSALDILGISKRVKLFLEFIVLLIQNLFFFLFQILLFVKLKICFIEPLTWLLFLGTRGVHHFLLNLTDDVRHIDMDLVLLG